MARPDAPEMNLPPGKTCGDCIHWAHCKRLICSLQMTSDSCDWSPSRFEAWPSEAAREVFTKPRPELGTVTASNSQAVLIEENVRLRAEVKKLTEEADHSAQEVLRLRAENEQLRAGKLPGGQRVTIQCPFCEAKSREIRALKDEIQRLKLGG